MKKLKTKMQRTTLTLDAETKRKFIEIGGGNASGRGNASLGARIAADMAYPDVMRERKK